MWISNQSPLKLPPNVNDKTSLKLEKVAAPIKC